MADPAPIVRAATPQDAKSLAELVNIAGEGLPLYLWQGLAEPTDTPWSVGESRAQRSEGSFSWRNATVIVDRRGAVEACLIGYPLPAQPAPIDYDSLPSMFAPLQELEYSAAGTWYVNVLAAYPAHRGRGHGSLLLAIAEQRALACCGGLSLIVADTNTGARRLYERQGFLEESRRPMVKEGWRHPGREWVLMLKRLDRRGAG
jgi:ribosomal protein S18 acetylase RimI-like enzyme